MAIAVIGAGIAGSVTALSLADCGHRVCVFERESTPLSSTSFINEGKVHLGYVYVNDPGNKTASMMTRTALAFRKVLERWISAADFDRLVTEPFDYIVPNDSLLQPLEIELKFRLLEKSVAEAEKAAGTTYLGQSGELAWSRSKTVPAAYDDSAVLAHYQTMERAVDPHAIAAFLTRCLQLHPNIELFTDTKVKTVSNEKGKSGQWRIRAASPSAGDPMQSRAFGPFEAVANASWDSRLELDEQVFGPDQTRWFHRYKAGLNVPPGTERKLPNFTAIIGNYGDIVNFPSGRVYLSWYPAGRTSASSSIGDLKSCYSDSTKLKIAAKIIAGVSRLVPSVSDALVNYQPKADHIAGGIIMARGHSDIDDRKSELHQRHHIGVREHRGFVSIDTGKYTCGPYFGVRAAEVIKIALGSE